MQYNRVGSSGLKVSRLCLESNIFGTQVDQETTADIVGRALDLGVNIIDTSNSYAKQKSEMFIGSAVKGRREGLVLATKVESRVAPWPNGSGLSRKHVMWQVRESLSRLQTDYIDLYYMHNFDPETPLEETLSTFDVLVKTGLVRYVGVSNFTVEQLKETERICEEKGLERPIPVQLAYSLIDRAIEKDILPLCREGGLGAMTFSPLAGGFLTGKYRKGEPPPQGTRASALSGYRERVDSGDFSVLETIASVAKDSGLSMRELALAWVAKNPVVTGAIVGASRPEQVEENCQAMEIKLTDDIVRRLDALPAT